jgi:hypothetical protein
MRRIWAFVLAAFVVILGLVTAGIAFGSGSGGEIAKPEVIRLVTKGGQFTFLPLNTSKHSLIGDQAVISAPVFNMGTDTKIGHQHAICTLMDKKGIVGECMIKTFLHDGEIVASAVVHFGVADHTLGAVTGGTGRYRNARGQVVLVNSLAATEGFIFRIEP